MLVSSSLAASDAGVTLAHLVGQAAHQLAVGLFALDGAGRPPAAGDGEDRTRPGSGTAGAGRGTSRAGGVGAARLDQLAASGMAGVWIAVSAGAPGRSIALHRTSSAAIALVALREPPAVPGRKPAPGSAGRGRLVDEAVDALEPPGREPKPWRVLVLGDVGPGIGVGDVMISPPEKAASSRSAARRASCVGGADAGARRRDGRGEVGRRASRARRAAPSSAGRLSGADAP